MQQMLQIKVIMNEDTKLLLENNTKLNGKVRDDLYNFAMRTLKQKGYAVFIFDNDTEDNCVILKANNTEEIIKLKKR